MHCLVYCLHRLFTLSPTSCGRCTMWQYVQCYYAGCLGCSVSTSNTCSFIASGERSVVWFRSLVCWFSRLWAQVPCDTSHLGGNRARRLAPAARQTKCVCLCSSPSLPCVHRRQSGNDSVIAALCFASCELLLLFFFFVVFFLSSSSSENNLPGVWLLISLSPWDKTGGLRLVVSHTVTKTKSDILEGSGYGKYYFSQQCLQSSSLFFMRKKTVVRYGLSLLAGTAVHAAFWQEKWALDVQPFYFLAAWHRVWLWIGRLRWRFMGEQLFLLSQHSWWTVNSNSFFFPSKLCTCNFFFLSLPCIWANQCLLPIQVQR